MCNAAYASDEVLVVGASASGHLGDTVLASITFRCNSEGATALSVVVDEFADATPGSPQPIGHGINAGRITCENGEGLPDIQEPTATDEPPVTGLPDSGAGSDTSSEADWLAAALATLGLVTLAASGAARLFAVRSENRG